MANLQNVPEVQINESSCLPHPALQVVFTAVPSSSAKVSIKVDQPTFLLINGQPFHAVPGDVITVKSR